MTSVEKESTFFLWNHRSLQGETEARYGGILLLASPGNNFL